MKRITKFAILIQLVKLLINWIHLVFKLSETVPIKEYHLLLDKLLVIAKSRGPEFLIKYIKGVRTALVIYLSGESKESVKGVRLTSDGLPLILGPLIKRIRQRPSPDILRMVMTVLFMTRALRWGTSPDYTTIEGPTKVGFPDSDGSERSFWRELGYRPATHTPRSLWFRKFHLSTKSGPNGHALWKSLSDLNLIDENHLNHLRIVGGPRLSKKLDTLKPAINFLSKVLPVDGKILRKLSWFPDVEDKVRIVAIGDYFTQSALKPLHHYLFRALKKIPQDCTFDQSSFRMKIKDWTDFVSVDLTAATDRFPVSLIFNLLRGHLPEDYCKSWLWLMVGSPFSIKDRVINYSVGNPMGFYSSWASFTLAHHYVMYQCANEIGIPWRSSKYVMLGDDILIGDLLLAQAYKRRIANLGVEFSPLKTHTSRTLCEFAKRYIYKGEEISPFPVSAIPEMRKRYYLLVSLLVEVECKGWSAIEGIPSAIRSFYQIVDKKNRTFSTVLLFRSQLAEVMIRIMRGTMSADLGLNTLIRQRGYPIRELGPDESHSILQNVAVEAFADSNPANAKSQGYPLGKLAEDLVIYITGSDSDQIGACPFELVQAVPHLSVYGQVEESYLDLTKQALRIDTIGKGEWPLVLRTMALPLDDRIFVQRNDHLLSRSAAIIGKALESRFDFLASPMGRAMLGPKA